jgi:hypothetical protein
MNKAIVITLCFFLIIIIGCNKKENLPKEVFIFSDNVKILAKADSKSAVLGTLNSHDMVEVLARVRTPNPNSSKDMPWWDDLYKIRFNDIEGYIDTNYTDRERHTFNINGNSIFIYPRLANGWYWCRAPYCLVAHSQEYSFFINDIKIYIPGFSNYEPFSKVKIIDGNVHLFYSGYSDVNSVAINIQDEKIYIIKKDGEKHEQYIINEKRELDYLGEYSVPGQFREGDFTIDTDGTLVAYWGTGGDIIIPETIAGITVRRTRNQENIFTSRYAYHYLRSVHFPSTIRFIYDHNVPIIIIDSNLNIKSAYNFADVYNQNGRKGGTYTNTTAYTWTYTP